MATNYAGASLDKVPSEGGSVRVEIDDNAGRGNGGTSLPCKKCWIIADSNNSGVIRVKIGSACGQYEGIPVPEHGTEHYVLTIEIDDVASLYFYGGNDTDDVDILYRK